MNGSQITQKDIEAFERPGPRYTSYPTVPAWKTPFDPSLYSQELSKLPADTKLSLYFHLPFCARLCHFCACTKIIDKDHRLGNNYLEHLLREIDLVAKKTARGVTVTQLHLGGGTPTYYSPEDLVRLAKHIRNQFEVSKDAECSLEANPVVTTDEHLDALKRAGFWRISFGVQDFDFKVQTVINREQSFEQTLRLSETARRLNYTSLNVDLIYGLPLQTQATMRDTIEKVNLIRPDRIALYSFAKVPWRQPFQRRFKDEDLPTGLEKVNLYLSARKLLEAAGYIAVGMDHFALQHDELFQARATGTLHRNFMGYTTKPTAQMIGFGLSGISMLSGVYSQNERGLNDYLKAIDDGRLPIERGLILSREDQTRRDIIMNLMCNFQIEFSLLEKKYDFCFAKTFCDELKVLEDFESKNLVALDTDRIRVLPRGQIFIRNIAMVFDQYLSTEERHNLFSQTV